MTSAVRTGPDDLVAEGAVVVAGEVDVGAQLDAQKERRRR